MAMFKTLRELLKHPKKDLCMCMVVSEQEGAEIWMNGEQTAVVTPRLVAIPKNEDVKIQVRMIGHEPHEALVRSSHNLSYYYCNLERIPLRLVRDEIDYCATV
ncbi:hypothetical protein [Bdellovibrio sp. HCB209]|uniref:hypothetical protein n=1 Tax=Bdellovibrio sp. HCB209 TaxID=3394354 RepID=UPI0039B58E1A